MQYVRVAIMVPKPGSADDDRKKAKKIGDDTKKKHYPPTTSHVSVVTGGDGKRYGLCIDIWDDEDNAKKGSKALEDSHKDPDFTNAIQAWAATEPFARP